MRKKKIVTHRKLPPEKGGGSEGGTELKVLGKQKPRPETDLNDRKTNPNSEGSDRRKTGGTMPRPLPQGYSKKPIKKKITSRDNSA